MHSFIPETDMVVFQEFLSQHNLAQQKDESAAHSLLPKAATSSIPQSPPPPPPPPPLPAVPPSPPVDVLLPTPSARAGVNLHGQKADNSTPARNHDRHVHRKQITTGGLEQYLVDIDSTMNELMDTTDF